MNDIVMKIIKGEKVPDQDLADELYEVCCSVHSSCGNDCPVFKSNCGSIPYEYHIVKHGRRKGQMDGECSCFKNGSEMLKFLRQRKEVGML